MSKSAAILSLAAAASAALSAQAYGESSAPAYGASSAPAYGASSSAPAYAASSSAPVYAPSSAPAYGASSSYESPISSAPYYGGSSSVVYYPSSSSAYPVSSSGAPVTPPFPGCWSECFQEAGVTSESDVCDNAEVSSCIHDKCDCEDSWSYYQWYNDYCHVPVSSSAPVYYPSSSSVVYYPSSSSVIYYPVSSSVSSAPASTPTIECWGKCFAQEGITSEEELCGNTAVNECISEGCDCEDDKAYWAWYESFCPAPSSSATPTSPEVPATPTPTDCWSTCFEEAGIASEDELCGNTAVSQCISSTCSPAEDKAYWEWYLSYCPAEGPVTTPCVTPVESATPTPSSPVDSCWSDCFAASDITSEADLCGNDEVSKCIHDTCSAPLDKAYWEWYNSFCAPVSTGYTTCTTTYTPITTPYSPVTTTYVSTETYGWTATGSGYGLPTPPATPVGPYQSWSPSGAPSGYPAGPTGTGYASPSASQWAPVPASGSGSATKPGVFFAAAMALVALF